MTDQTDRAARINAMLNGDPSTPWKKDGLLAGLTKPGDREQLKLILQELQGMLPLRLGVSFWYGKNADIRMSRLGTATSITWRERTNGEKTIELKITMEGMGPPLMKGEVKRFETIRIPTALV